MRKIDFMPDQDDPEQLGLFYDGIRNVYGKTKVIQNIVEEWFQIQSRRSIRPQSVELRGEQLKCWRTLQGPPVKIQRFSDGLFVFTSLAKTKEFSPICSVFSLLSACGSIMFTTLAGGLPIRGGLDVGAGMEMNENELYGPVVARAYELESEIAQYPRIVVGKQCLQYLEECCRQKEKGIKPEYEKAMAVTCQELLMEDCDGSTIVDFLGEGFRHHIAYNIPLEDFYKAYTYVNDQLGIHEKDRNDKLSARYSQLLKYFKKSRRIWSENHNTS